ncbi:right-handed parallel beta-helix repeat-containing protein [Amycolatopsis sp. NPDC026612]|uniref:right-handed parallel beta-helix repeat-containing protein n=1 Tax=Amycolatopsis sp. NPDC026612 TaxID=3155466 RepID=UPI0033ECB705
MFRVLRHPAPGLFAVALLAASVPAVLAAPAGAQAAGVSYYVDAAQGNDSAAGTDSAHAWRSLARVGQTTFRPGDRILLRAGGRWTGQLWPKGSGASGAPVTVDRYGDGANPRIDGAGAVGDTVRLADQEFWTIRHLEVTNQAPATSTPGANLKDLRGIHVTGSAGRPLHGFVVDGVNVHDVTGEVNWISGDTADNAPGIHFKMGWDRSKKTGGIVFDAAVANPGAPAAPTVLDDITVQNSVIANTSFAGIVVKQYSGDAPGAVATGWGSRTSAGDTRFTPHTNVVIRGNHLSQPGTAYGCNGVYLTGVRHAVVEQNVVDRAGTSGIEAYFADDVTIQSNEVAGTTPKAHGADSNGIDADKGTTKVVVQYNWSHGNGDGILLCQFVFGDVVLRYNVIAGNTRYPVYLHSDKASKAKVYGNTLYNDRGKYLVYGYGTSLTSTYDISDNILYSKVAGASLTTSSTIRYDSNLYGGATLPVPAGDAHAVRADPQFTGAPDYTAGTPQSGPRLTAAYGLRVRSGSPAIDRGVAISGNGGRDYAGAPLYTGKPDIGAFEVG